MVPAPMMGAVPQQWSMPYAQLNVQQAQQWAGIAPGYMSYQHPSAAPHAVPHAAPHAAPAGIPGQPQGVGYGTFHVGSPSAAHAMNNNSSVNGAGAHRSSQHTMSDYEATVVNNEPPRSPQVLRGSKPPPALTPELEAEPVASPRPPADVHLRRPPGWAPPGASPSAGGDEAVTTIYIGNLPPSVDEMALMWTCGYFGPVAHAQIIRDNKTQVSRGYGFVTFAHPAYATVAMQQLNGQVMYGPFGGQKIRVAPTNKHV